MLGFSPLTAGPLAALPAATEASGTADAYVTAPMGGQVLGTDGSTFVEGSASGAITAEASGGLAVTATATAVKYITTAASGAIAVNGAAVVVKLVTTTASGGLAVTATATAVKYITTAASGAIAVNGAASVLVIKTTPGVDLVTINASFSVSARFAGAATAAVAITATGIAASVRASAGAGTSAITVIAGATRQRNASYAAAPILNYFCAHHSLMGGSTNHSATSTTTYVVSVSYASGGNKYYLNGVQQPLISLAPGATYTFDQGIHSSNSNHPLRLSKKPGGTHFGGSTYNTGVTYVGTPGQAGSYTQIVVPASASIAGTASGSSFLLPFFAVIPIAVSAAAPAATRTRLVAATAAVAVNSASVDVTAIRPLAISAGAAITASAILLPDPINYSSKNLITGSPFGLTSSFNSASVAPRVIKYLSAAGSTAISATNIFTRHRLVDGSATLQKSGTAEMKGFLRTVSANASIGATGSASYQRVDAASATASISASSAGGALARFRFSSATALAALGGTSAPMSIRAMFATASLNASAANTNSGLIKRANGAASIGTTASGTVYALFDASATAAISVTAIIAAQRLELRISDAIASIAVTATASCVGLLDGSAQAAITCSGAATSIGILGPTATENVTLLANVNSRARYMPFIGNSVSITGVGSINILGAIWAAPTPVAANAPDIWIRPSADIAIEEAPDVWIRA